MKANILSIIIATGIVVSAIFFVNGNNSTKTINEQPVNNVSVVDNKQIIEITAKGGYSPRKTVAKAGIPTILRFNTNSTYDCSSAVYIPSMKINANLPATGSTEIDIGTPEVSTLKVTCSMGMYSFGIEFQ